jgi:hypothetical protein
LTKLITKGVEFAASGETFFKDAASAQESSTAESGF